ncbi:T9SS type B sorting domain-containing protein [Flavobacterium xinjiangense]|uniref:Gliding motility-associated C-terminal domain-containing protein n=1 Tax=Flavobacterium xinjiangense TaxID=178356 RepID=A0A1M7IVR5_9FLAO|nr:T9SS type B sorting domain-containing protein [Flavobacterium xinjiangense]SHM44821.1 gliding motility-associated C-terminal domain-containing protein [Flavobacterium xinjiangense]
MKLKLPLLFLIISQISFGQNEKKNHYFKEYKSYRSIFIALYLIIFLSFSVKMSSQTIQWQNTIGGNDTEWADFIELSKDGNYILGGYSHSNISGDKSENSRGASDYWFIKIDDVSGNLSWQKTIGGNNYDHLTSAKETTDGGYILGGYSSSGISGEKTQNSRGADDYWVVKLDANRNIIWDKTFGGTGVDRLTSIIQTSDGGYLIGGSSNSNISGEKADNSRGNLDMWIIKIDASGNIMWQKTFGGNNSDWVQSIVKTTDGGYILAGSSHSNISGEKSENSRGLGDFWFLKIDSTGTIVWQKTIGGNNGDYAKSIIATSEGNYIIGGDSSSNISGDKTEKTVNNSTDVWLLKINDLGQILWQKDIGADSTEAFADIRMTSDNGFILGIMSYSGISGYKTEASRGDRDYWIVKLDSTGKFEWDKTVGGDSLDQTQSIVQAKDGGYVALGWSQSTISGDKTENKSRLQDFWVVKLQLCSQNLSATSNSPICSGDTVQLSATGGTNYSWTGPNGFTSLEQNPSILNANASQSGQYTCSITGTGGCDDKKSANVVINIQPLPTANSPQSFCISQNAKLIDVIISGQNLKWYDSLMGITLLPASTVLQDGMNYYASQTVANCESNRIMINTRILALANCDLTGEDTSSLSYPKFFTPNGDAFNDTWNIKFSDVEEDLTVKIFDRYGKLIVELKNNSAWNGTFNGQELTSTDYWFVVTRANGKEYRGHFSLKR